MNQADIRVIHGLPGPAGLVVGRFDIHTLAGIGLLAPPANVLDELDLPGLEAFDAAAAAIWPGRGNPWPAIQAARAALVARFRGGWPVPRGLDPYHLLAEPVAWGADVLADEVHHVLWDLSARRQAEARKAISALAAFRDGVRAGKRSGKRLEAALVAMARADALPMIAIPGMAP